MLRVEKLNVSYGKVPVLYDVDFNVDDCAIVTLLGSNGAGKSSIMNAIMGLIKLSSGSIYFEETRIDVLSTDEIVKLGIALVPEGRELFVDMTVDENLYMGGYTHKSKREVEKNRALVFDVFPILKERRGQVAKTLSGGEQQMLAIGRCLMLNPKLMLFDEPSLGLAPLVVREIFRIIKDINGQGVSVLLVEQNANISLSISQSAFILETGRIVYFGSAKDLLLNDKVKKTYLGE